jgi:hypothetical protein
MSHQCEDEAERVKENIVPFEGTWNEIKQLAELTPNG